MKRATAASMLQLRVGTVAFMTREGSKWTFAALSTDGGCADKTVIRQNCSDD
jgi:hypothetical protein